MRFFAVVAAALALIPACKAAVPADGRFEPGVHLAGVRLGDRPAAVTRRWGARTGRVGRTWLWFPPGKTTGVAARFDSRWRAEAVFTLGLTFGWRTVDGVRMGAWLPAVVDRYGTSTVVGCVGYTAMLYRIRGSISVFLIDEGGVIYGFELMRPGEQPCV